MKYVLYILVIGFTLLTRHALAQSPPSPSEPTVTLTQSELAVHDEAVGAKAVAQYIFNESSQRAHAVEAKLSAAFTPKPPAALAAPPLANSAPLVSSPVK